MCVCVCVCVCVQSLHIQELQRAALWGMCGDQGLVAVENTGRVSEQWWTVGGAAQLPGESHAWVQDSWKSLQGLLKISARTFENLCRDSWKSLQGLLKTSAGTHENLSRDCWRALQGLLKISAGTLQNICRDSSKSLQGLLKISAGTLENLCRDSWRSAKIWVFSFQPVSLFESFFPSLSWPSR